METVRTDKWMNKPVKWNGEAGKARQLKNGDRYLHLFPRAELKNTLVKRGADVTDTIHFIPKAVKLTSNQVKKYVQQELSGYSLMETCRRLWQFLYDHVGYKKDEPDKEQIKSPARTMHDRTADCDDYATFISAVLTVKSIPHLLRVTKYSGSWQHIYVVVPVAGAGHITLDCVVDRFNYEVPYTDKIDVKMDLEFLSGYDSAGEQLNKYVGRTYPGYTMSGLGASDFGELGKILRKGKLAPKTVVKKAVKTGGQVIKTAGKVAKEGLHVLNRLNPATVLLRNGILASMKLNVMNVAARIKWAYLTEAQAWQQGINPAKHRQLKNVLSRLEKIFYGAGGKPSNLKDAILKGKGNARKEVHGLGLVDWQDIAVSGLERDLSISELLGIDMYLDENQGYLSSLSGQGFGEPATATALATASGAIAAIAAAISQIGNIFDKKAHPDFKDGNKEDSTASSTKSVVNQADRKGENVNINPSPDAVSPSEDQPGDEPEPVEVTETPQVPARKEQSPGPEKVSVPSSQVDNKDKKEEQSFMQKYGTVIKVAGGIVVTTGLLIMLAKMSGTDKSKKESGLSGAPRKQAKRRIKTIELS